MNEQTVETAEQKIARLEAENARLKAAANGPLKLKISEKGALSIYGLGRFPVTLYKKQWIRLLSQAKTIADFIRENETALKDKSDQQAAA